MGSGKEGNLNMQEFLHQYVYLEKVIGPDFVVVILLPAFSSNQLSLTSQLTSHTVIKALLLT